jgi:hypothetical protein
VAKIIREGCIPTCGHCNTTFSFDPGEVQHSTRHVPAGYSPEEEAYDKSIFTVSCPKCHRAVNVENQLGALAKKEIAQRPKRSDDDL